MNKNISYSSYEFNLDEKIKYKKVIPYSLHTGEKYRKGKWYYCKYDNLFFKVLDVEYNRGQLISAYIKTEEGNYCSIATDISDDDYLMEKDRFEIYKVNNIFNTKIAYTGAEIIYWFFMHNITCFDRKYIEFWKYVDRYSPDRLDEKTKYLLFSNRDRYNNLTHIRVQEDVTDIIGERELASRQYHEKDIEFLKHDIENKSSRE